MDGTAILLQRIRDGDERAREELARAYLPVARLEDGTMWSW